MIAGLLALLLAFAGAARADQAVLVVRLDLDRNPGTGCASATAEGAVPGVELWLRTVVDLDTRQVVSASHSRCAEPSSGVFGPEIQVSGGSTPPWSVVDGDGTSGSTLIETYLPLSVVPGVTVAHAYLDLTSPAGSDALLSATGSGAGPPIEIAIGSVAVPTLPNRARSLLALGLAAVLALSARRRPRAAIALVLASLGDGALRDWSPYERVAIDLQGDAPQEADIAAAFAGVDPDAGLLLLRVDAFFGPEICLDWPTIDPGSGYSCAQEPPPDAGPFGLRVALTFDDGPNLATTPSIVQTLRNEGVPATFFMLGYKLETPETRALALEIHADPLFEVANHSYSHARFTTLTVEQMRSEIAVTNQNLRIALGDACHHPRFFRIPYSASSCASAGVVREHGLSMVGFHVDTLDWCYAIGSGYCSPAYVSWLPPQYQSDMVGWTLTRLALYGGGVAILHDSQANTAAQLPALIAALRGAGVTFVSLGDASVFPLINAAVNPPEPPACCEF